MHVSIPPASARVEELTEALAAPSIAPANERAQGSGLTFSEPEA
jgi:hypothetical protein